MAKTVVKGLVLRQTKVHEADAILLLFTADKGLISASAKGCLRVNSRLVSACALFCYSEFTLAEGRTMYTVTEAQPINSFFALRQSVEGMATAMYMAEIAANLSPVGEDAEAQLRLLLNCFYLIGKAETNLKKLKAIYEMRTFSNNGYMPALLGCEQCGAYDGNGFAFDPAHGTLLCAKCAAEAGQAGNLDAGALMALRHIALSEDKKVFSFALAPSGMQCLSRVCEQYAAACLDKPMKTLPFLNSLLAEQPANNSPEAQSPKEE